MRLAIVSPLPPAPTGIADYTIDVVRALRPMHAIDLFHDQIKVAGDTLAPAYGIEELPARNAAAAYDVIVYQMGNGPAHDFMYDWMERAPGVVVLHDLVLHHSFVRRFLESPAARAYALDPSSEEKRRGVLQEHERYRQAIEGVHEGQGERLKAASLNSTGDLLPYAFPFFEPALRQARAVGAHNEFMVDAIQAACPGIPCSRLAMPVQAAQVRPEVIEELRKRLGLFKHDVVIGCFGLVTREKGIETVARAFKRVAELNPNLRLLLAGDVPDQIWLDGVLERARVTDRTVVAGRLSPHDFEAAMEIANVVVQLRYPTARETSAAVLRVMAQGRPVVISDLANQSEIPDDTVIRVDLTDEEGALARALDDLSRNPERAQAMGERARAFAAKNHSDQQTLETYERLLKSVRPHYSPPSP